MAPPSSPAVVARALPHLRRPTLLARFGTVALLIVLALGAAVAHQMQAVIGARAKANAEASAQVYLQLVKQSFLAPMLQAGVQPGAATDQQIALSEELTRDPLIREQVLGATAWSADGTVLYSTAAATIGTTEQLPPSALAALNGGTASELAAADRVSSDWYDPADHVGEQVLVVDMPLSIIGDERPEVVIEIVTSYAATAAAIRQDVAQMCLWLVIGLLTLYVALFRLVATASRRLRQQSATNRDLALHDALTGLPNRSMLHDLADEAIARGRRHGSDTALLLLDLDRFKEINDTLGHHHGDLLLAMVGPRLREVLGERDTVARLGGDEFVILLPEVDGEAGSLLVAGEVLAALDRPFVVDGVDLDVGSSLGIAVSPHHGHDFETLLRHADVAMYSAKEQQTGIAVYDAEQDANSPARLALLGELRRGIDADQLVLHFQPKADIGGSIIGAEALVRWQHPTRGLIGPDEFIPLAERTGLIRSLTLVVLDEALRQAALWADAGHPLPVAVNISARCLLDPDLAQSVSSALERHGVTGDRLELEITESTVMVDPDRALDVLRSLAGLGVRLAIDDFGTGYSSLGYLQRLPVHEIKIDRSFVMEMAEETNEVIVSASIDLGRKLGLHVIAEGVEDQATWDRLAELGCHAVQGYHLSRPVAGDVLEAWLEARAAAPVPHQR